MSQQVRRCTVLDINECLKIAVDCYKQKFDPQRGREWAEKMLFDANHGFFRTDDAWGCATLANLWYEDKPRAMMLFLAGRPGSAWQACALLEAMVEWARGNGATSFNFGEETGMRMDVLARRLNAKLRSNGLAVEIARPSFKVDLAPPSTNTVANFWNRAA